MSERPTTELVLPECRAPREILYRDDDLLIVNKPAFLMTVPAKLQDNKDCVIHRLWRDFPEAAIAHRLDLDTSGILVVPLHAEALRHINRQFQLRAVHKTYTAVVYGEVEADAGTIDLPMGPGERPRQRVDWLAGKQALTDFRVLARDPATPGTRLRLHPVTGRSHQLRLHLAAIGHPIIGCDMYAHEAALALSPRLLLHATSLEFTHPRSGERFHWEHPPAF